MSRPWLLSGPRRDLRDRREPGAVAPAAGIAGGWGHSGWKTHQTPVSQPPADLKESGGWLPKRQPPRTIRPTVIRGPLLSLAGAICFRYGPSPTRSASRISPKPADQIRWTATPSVRATLPKSSPLLTERSLCIMPSVTEESP